MVKVCDTQNWGAFVPEVSPCTAAGMRPGPPSRRSTKDTFAVAYIAPVAGVKVFDLHWGVDILSHVGVSRTRCGTAVLFV